MEQDLIWAKMPWIMSKGIIDAPIYWSLSILGLFSRGKHYSQLLVMEWPPAPQFCGWSGADWFRAVTAVAAYFKNSFAALFFKVQFCNSCFLLRFVDSVAVRSRGFLLHVLMQRPFCHVCHPETALSLQTSCVDILYKAKKVSYKLASSLWCVKVTY